MSLALSDERVRAAELLIALGPKRAAAMLQGLPEDEVERLLSDVARLGPLPPERVRAVLAELSRTLVQRQVAMGGLDFAGRLLEELYGSQRAATLVDRIDPTKNQPFMWLADNPVDQIARALRDEPPASVALALVHLPADTAAPVLRALPEDLRADVAHRMASLTHVAPDVITAINQSMRERIEPALSQELYEVPGVELVVELLNQSPPKVQKALVESIRQRDEQLAAKILESLFVFDDIVILSDRAIQEVLKTVDSMDLAIALHSSSPEVSERIYRNLSERAAANLQEEIEYLQSPRPAETKASKGRIVASIRQLEESGAIQIDRPVADDEGE